jgi:hypothetical protein
MFLYNRPTICCVFLCLFLFSDSHVGIFFELYKFYVDESDICDLMSDAIARVTCAVRGGKSCCLSLWRYFFTLCVYFVPSCIFSAFTVCGNIISGRIRVYIALPHFLVFSSFVLKRKDKPQSVI